MYCTNCGNKVDENAYVCVNCGVIVKKDNSNRVVKKVQKNKGNSNGTGIASIVVASIGILISLCGFLFGDVDAVSLYTKVSERIFFAFGYNLFQLIFMIVSLVLSLVNGKNKYNRIGLGLTLGLAFLIVSEFVVIIIY